MEGPFSFFNFCPYKRRTAHDFHSNKTNSLHHPFSEMLPCFSFFLFFLLLCWPQKPSYLPFFFLRRVRKFEWVNMDGSTRTRAWIIQACWFDFLARISLHPLLIYEFFFMFYFLALLIYEFLICNCAKISWHQLFSYFLLSRECDFSINLKK